MKTKVTYGKPTKKQVEKFERTVKEMVEGRMTDAVAKLVARWRSSEWAYAHLGPASDKPTEEICADELEAALATAPPEQAATDEQEADDIGELALELSDGNEDGPWTRALTFPNKLYRVRVVGGIPPFGTRADQPQPASDGALILTADPAICHGALCFAGTRVMLECVLGGLQAGESIDEICAGYPTVKREHIELVAQQAAALASHDQKVRGEVAQQAAEKLTELATKLRDEVPEAMGVAWDVITGWIAELRALAAAPAASKPSHDE